MQEPTFNDIPLSISECAKMFGLSDKTIRRAIKTNELPHIIIKDRYRIMFVDLLKWSQGRPRLTHSRDGKGIGQYVSQWQVPNSKKIKEEKISDNKNQLTIFSNSNSQLEIFK